MAYRAPRFSNLSLSVIDLATVTPSAGLSFNTKHDARVNTGLTLGDLGATERLFNDDVATCTTWVSYKGSVVGGYDLPLGPRVTLTALARTSTPFNILARPSLENLISLWAPRARIGRAAFVAALRAARDDEDEIACIVLVFLRKEKSGDDEENPRWYATKRDGTETRVKNFPAGKI